MSQRSGKANPKKSRQSKPGNGERVFRSGRGELDHAPLEAIRDPSNWTLGPDRSKTSNTGEWFTVGFKGKPVMSVHSKSLAPINIDLDDREHVKLLAVATSNEDTPGIFTFTDGDLKDMARLRYLQTALARPKKARAGHERAAAKPRATAKRDEQMKADYIVARTHDGMKGPEATRYVAEKYGLTRAQVCRRVKPRAQERNMRRS